MPQRVGDEPKEAIRLELVKRGNAQAVERVVESTLQVFASKQEIATGKLISALKFIETLAKAGADKRKLEDAVLPYLAVADWKAGSFEAALVARDVGGEKSIEPLINIVKMAKREMSWIKEDFA